MRGACSTLNMGDVLDTSDGTDNVVPGGQTPSASTGSVTDDATLAASLGSAGLPPLEAVSETAMV